MPEDAIAVIVNLPTPQQILLLNITETLYLHETEEKIIFIRWHEHTAIEIYSVKGIWDAGNLTVNKIYSNLDCRKDFTIALQAIRPEGILDYKILISLPNGLVKEYFLSYDGKNGNPNIEYVSN
ncbi:MAG: hypothetical protein PHQ49_05445 [Clostridia bacterium]|nr:hypothetical protein [Clostridia bacterium]